MSRPIVIVGAQRCATTFLYRALDRHPSIRMARPERPEPKWFLGPAAAGATAADWRRDCFGDEVVPGAAVLGEKSTSYIESDVAAERIAAILPDALVVVSLRDPADRAVSNYRFSVRNGIEGRDPATALLGDGQPSWDRARFSVSPFDYIGRSRYVDHLPRWWSSGLQVEVVLAEQVVGDPSVVQTLHAAVGVRPIGDTRPASPVNDSTDAPEVPPDVVAELRRRLRPVTEQLTDQVEAPLARFWPTLG